MITRKSYKFLLKLTKKQAKTLRLMLEECRWLYNAFLEQRILAYQELDMQLTKYDQLMMLPEMKVDRPSLELVHSQVLQNVGDRLDKSFQNFFRRVKNGETPGFPRFRGMYRYSSFCFPQSGFSFAGNLLKLSKVGNIRVKMHREILGKIKTCTLIQNASGSWHVVFSCEVEVAPLPEIDKAVGIDVGLENFATLTDGQIISNPRFYKESEKVLAKEQRRLSKLKKGSPERRRQGKRLAKIHEKIANRRRDFCHKLSKKIVHEYQYICIEDLNIKKMVQENYLAKGIHDASWNQFRQFLTYKAVEAGRKLGVANPAYTSQECSKCHHREYKPLSQRRHVCKCGYETTRDFNSAENILAIGLDGLGVIPGSLRL